MQWGKKWPVQMNLPFFAVEAYVPGGVQNQAEKNSKKCLLAGTGTKVYFSRKLDLRPHPQDPLRPPPLEILYALYSAGKTNTYIKNLGA